MSASASWDDVINELDGPQPNNEFISSLQNSGALFDDEEDYSASLYRNSSSSSFQPIVHRRSMSLNNDRLICQLPPLNIPRAPQFFSPTKNLLPSHINKLFEEEPNFSLDGYDEFLDKNDMNSAQQILQHLLSKAKDKREQSKIFRAAANSNKRHFFNNEACHLYELAEEAESELPQNYIDHAKLLDEIGFADKAETVLENALINTQMSEQVIIKLIKQFERRQRFDKIRDLLGRVYHYAKISKVTALSLAEGVLFEARHGVVYPALAVYEAINPIVELKSGFFVDLSEFLRRRKHPSLALKYAQLGVERFPSMPNNWTQLMQLQRTPNNVILTLKHASERLSPLMVTKMEQSAAFLCASLDDLSKSRSIISECLVHVPSDLRWRVLHNASLIEALYGDSTIVLLLLDTAAKFTPNKFATTILLALAKMYEINGDIKSASNSYLSLVKNHNSDWRVFLERSMFFVRNNQRHEALECAKTGLLAHPSTGRLWALRVQLEDEESQIPALREAIMNSPKSGEIWTEAARIALNPLSPFFNLKSAKFFLNTAFLFTPQYIDLFIEMVRLEILENGTSSMCNRTKELYFSGDGNYGTVIYQFRRPGKEFTEEEFSLIVHSVSQDIVAHSKLYQRAISRTYFVVESLRIEEDKLKKDQEKMDKFKFSFGLTSFLEAMTNPSNSEVYKSIILGSSSVLI